MWENKKTAGFVTSLIRNSYLGLISVAPISLVNPDIKSSDFFYKLLKWQFFKYNSLHYSFNIQVHR